MELGVCPHKVRRLCWCWWADEMAAVGASRGPGCLSPSYQQQQPVVGRVQMAGYWVPNSWWFIWSCFLECGQVFNSSQPDSAGGAARGPHSTLVHPPVTGALHCDVMGALFSLSLWQVFFTPLWSFSLKCVREAQTCSPTSGR